MVLSNAMATLPLQSDANGVIRVASTRVTLESLLTAFQQGGTPEQIHQQFDAIPLADIYSVIGYYLQHRVELDTYLLQAEQECEQLSSQENARAETAQLRERLLARKTALRVD